MRPNTATNSAVFVFLSHSPAADEGPERKRRDFAQTRVGALPSPVWGVLFTGAMTDRRTEERQKGNSLKENEAKRWMGRQESQEGYMWTETPPCGSPARLAHEPPYHQGALSTHHMPCWKPLKPPGHTTCGNQKPHSGSVSPWPASCQSQLGC